MNQNLIKNHYFRRLNLITLISVYFLILVGGIVRSTGAGMGCPDWPKCFGKWVPPTSVEQLPANYQQELVAERIHKNEKFANYLDALGFVKMAEEIRNDESIHQSEVFNPQKTWTEYINRLVGAAVGILVFLTFLSALPLIKSDPILPIISFLTFVTVGFQGWIGSLVVSTNLLSWMITVHMLIALVIVGLLLYLFFRSNNKYKEKDITNAPRTRINVLLFFVFGISLLQIIVGTNVRETVDEIAGQVSFTNAGAWIDQLGFWFKFHRSFALVIIFAHLLLVYLIFKNIGNQWYAGFWSLILIALVITEALSGMILAYFGLPGMIQPLHLVLAALVFGVQLWMIFKLNFLESKSELNPLGFKK